MGNVRYANKFKLEDMNVKGRLEDLGEDGRKIKRILKKWNMVRTEFFWLRNKE
jgi:hypothetical protein